MGMHRSSSSDTKEDENSDVTTDLDDLDNAIVM